MLAAALLVTIACSNPDDMLRIATTTTVGDSGLLEAVFPSFTRETGILLRVIATGSGQAFNLARRHDVALLITHEPSGEQALIAEGLVRHYRKIMFNHFVIAGPPNDPARVRGASSAAEAMRRIAESGAPFISRGDASGTHVREQALWTAAGATPASGLLVETGQGMGPTLRVASERDAYVLTDEGTLAQLSATLRLGVLFLGDPALINTYAVSVLSSASEVDAARASRLAGWLAQEPARGLIAGFQANGRQVFFPWPLDADASRPDAIPVAR